MTDDEKFDMWLRDAAREYNAPPGVVPRDEMWRAIRDGVQSGEIPGDGGRPAATTLASSGARQSARTQRTWLAAAAVALLIAGAGAGYWMRGSVTTPPPSAVVAGSSTVSRPPENAALDAALMHHLTDAEAMLVSYRGRSQTSDDEAHLRDWARDVLGTTRLLLDTPAASDPSRRRLLEDLELLVVQIVQLPAGAPTDERALIDRSMTRDQILTRLRTSIPAGTTSGT